MQLTDTTKGELKGLLRKYHGYDRIVDEKFVNEAMEIINGDSNIDGKIKYEVSKKFILARSKYENGVNYFDINGIRNFVAKFPDLYNELYDEDYAGIIANIFALYYILHDVYKIVHRLGLTGFEELDRVYHDLYQKIDQLSKIKYAKYVRSQKHVMIERNADVQAFRELIDINNLSNVRLIPILQYLEFLLKGYEQGEYSPMRLDFDYLGLDYDKYDFSNIPFLDALEHGVTEDGENITQASILRKNFYDDKISFDEVYKDLRKVQ